MSAFKIQVFFYLLVILGIANLYTWEEYRYVIQYIHSTNIKAEIDSTLEDSAPAPSFTTIKYWVENLSEAYELPRLRLTALTMNRVSKLCVFCQSEYDTDLRDFEIEMMLRDSADNHTKYSCIWRSTNNPCPDPDINFYYYRGYSSKERKKKINSSKKNFLSEINWDPHKHNIVYIHGYGGGDGTFPNYILRDAYTRNGSYNVFVVDWGPLARIPCYTAAVHNLHSVAKCTGYFYKNLRAQGVPSNRITCVGHSLGAHGCGLVSNYVNFRMHRIVGLDPAGPMIPSSSRLRSGMADSVQVMHTNAGTFGDSVSSGRVNFCMNGGKTQPPCDSTSLGSDLCSHVIAVCYWAESIDGSRAHKAQPCSRQCPYGPRKSHRSGQAIIIGEHTPDRASGSYCVYTNEPPYCPKGNNLNGHPWCCLGKRATKKEKELAKVWNKLKPK